MTTTSPVSFRSSGNAGQNRTPQDGPEPNTIAAAKTAADAPDADANAEGSPPPPPQVALGPADRAVIAAAEKALLDERRLLTADELSALASLPDGAVMNLAALAHQVRLAWCGPEVEIEGILSAKTGGCPEDCHFCSQSSRFETPVKATPFLDQDEVLNAARETAALGASEFCIVLALRGPDERTMQRLLDLVPVIQDETGLNVAVSAGILTEEQARRLAEGGVHRYNHNVETARSVLPRNRHHPYLGRAGRHLPDGQALRDGALLWRSHQHG